MAVGAGEEGEEPTTPAERALAGGRADETDSAPLLASLPGRC
jgi:hypothetical protein